MVMRRLSRIFAVITLLIPLAVYGYLFGSTFAYQREHGINPDGKGNFDVITLGLRGLWLCALLAGAAAVVALMIKKGATSRLQRLEVASICLLIPVAALVARFMFGTWQATLHALLGL
jgi:hypothetical protein